MSYGDMSVSGAKPVERIVFSNGDGSQVSKKEEMMFDYGAGVEQTTKTKKGAPAAKLKPHPDLAGKTVANKTYDMYGNISVIRDENGTITRTITRDADGNMKQYSDISRNTETIYMVDKDGKAKPFSEHVYNPQAKKGTATPYVNGKLDPSHTLEYRMGKDENGAPYLIDKPGLPKTDAEMTDKERVDSLASTMTPQEAKEKWKDVKFEQAVDGGFAAVKDDSGRIINMVYTDKKGNIVGFTDLTYRANGTRDKDTFYSLHDGQYRLSNVVTYSADNKTAVEQGYSHIDGRPSPGSVNYVTQMIDGKLTLSFEP